MSAVTDRAEGWNAALDAVAGRLASLRANPADIADFDFDIAESDFSSDLDAARAATPAPALRELDAEIARRESADYQRFPKANDNQTPTERAGSAAARAMQHGELIGLKLARSLAASAPVAAGLAVEPRRSRDAIVALGDLLIAEHGESCDCETCLAIQPLVDARLASEVERGAAEEGT